MSAPEPTTIEAQVINTILINKDFNFLARNGLDISYFPGYEDEYKFLVSEYKKYGRVPDISTFLAKFPDYDFFKVDEAEASLVAKIKEQKGYSLLLGALGKINEIGTVDSIKAIEEMITQGRKILESLNIGRTLGSDLIKEAQSRLEDYKRRVELRGVTGISTGIKPLDIALNGWQPIDLVFLGGRLGEGKSWILLYFLLKAWLQKKKILLLDLENFKSLTGFRFDTLLGHFSNTGLLLGNTELLKEGDRVTKTDKDYQDYIDSLKDYDTPFIRIGVEDLGSEKMTVELLEALIDEHQPDLVGIDQLSLITVKEKVSTIREGYVKTTRALRRLTLHKKVPILVCSQVSREHAKERMRNKDATPEVHHFSESDSIGQDALRLLTFRNVDGILKIDVKKNTYGKSGQRVMMKWDIDSGVLIPINLEDSSTTF